MLTLEDHKVRRGILAFQITLSRRNDALENENDTEHG